MLLDRRFIFTSLTLAALTLSGALTARVDTVTVVGDSTGVLSTATVKYKFDAGTNTLTFIITNTSPHDATVTGIGFDLPPTGHASLSGLNGFSGANAAGFTFSDADLGNVPQFNAGVLDFGWTTGPSGTFAGGSPNGGIAPGGSLTFTVSGAGFAGLSEAQISNAIFVRFQRVGAEGAGQ